MRANPIGMSDAANGLVRVIARLTGRVQGVGYRDAVVAIAGEFDVAGTVRNVRTSDALEIDVEGAAGEVERFLKAVVERRPSFARVAAIERRYARPASITGFERAPTVP